MSQAIRRILIIRFSSLGDLVLMTPLLRECKRVYPEAQVDLVTSTSFAPLLANFPGLNQLYPLDRKGGKETFQELVQLLRTQDYDLILDAHQSLRSRLLLLKLLGWRAWTSTKVRRMDKRSFKRQMLLSFKWDLLSARRSQRQVYLELLPNPQGLSLDASTCLFPSPADQARVQSLLEAKGLGGKRLVALGPSASFPGKCWPRESFLELGLGLVQAGYGVLLLGGKGDPEPAWLAEASQQRLVNLAGDLSFLESAALLGQCQLAISNDSAIVHFAEAMQTPALAFFGPTVAQFGFGPFLPQSRILELDLPCRPCSRNGKGKCSNPIQRQCLREIAPGPVLEAALALLTQLP